MAAPLRIAQHKGLSLAPQKAQADPAKDYVDRLVKLIPGEIVALYLVGKTQIADRFVQLSRGAAPNEAGGTEVLSEPAAWIGWTLFCLAALVLVRRWATSDTAAGVPPEWPAVAIAAVSFVIWVYSLGDVFAHVLHVWDPLLASLLVFGWTFLVPMLYSPKK